MSWETDPIVRSEKAQYFIYTLLPKTFNASLYYRCVVPVLTLEEMGLGWQGIVDDNEASIPSANRIAAIMRADINLFYQPIGESLVTTLQQAKQFRPAKDEAGNWKWPPSFIIDTDDNLLNVSPLNGAYRTLGIRAPDGTLLNKGAEVGIVGENGERKKLWKDGENGFDVDRNLKTLSVYRDIVRLCDYVTCSTPRVAEYVKEETGQDKTFVFPNCVRFDHYDNEFEKLWMRRPTKDVRILWQGSPTHYEDWYPLKDALGKLAKKYPEIKWVIWGAKYPWVLEYIPAERIDYIPWVPYHEYRQRLVTVGHDISLAPLTPSKFNMSRSAIKWYEASVLALPAVTVAQNWGPYADEIEDGRTGVLFNDPEQFVEKVSWMVEDIKARREIASNAKDWLSDNRDAFKMVPKLHEFYVELREKKKRELDPPSEEEWNKFVEEVKEMERKEREAANAEVEAVIKE